MSYLYLGEIRETQRIRWNEKQMRKAKIPKVDPPYFYGGSSYLFTLQKAHNELCDYVQKLERKVALLEMRLKDCENGRKNDESYIQKH